MGLKGGRRAKEENVEEAKKFLKELKKMKNKAKTRAESSLLKTKIAEAEAMLKKAKNAPKLNVRKILKADLGKTPTFVRYCSHCENKLYKWVTCAACKSEFYCGRPCQKAHWKKLHKKQCKVLKKLKDGAKFLSEEDSI